MTTNTNTNTNRFSLSDDPNIYIDCSPVDIIGNEVTETEDGNFVEPEQSVLQNIGTEINSGQITENLGIQLTIAVTFFAIIFGLGNYVFKTIPNNMLEKRINENS